MVTRERLVDAAERIIRERGIGAVTTKEVARETGLAEATLYRHFADKTALLLAVFGERMPGNFLTQISELPARAGTGTVAAHLEALVVAALAFFAQTAPLSAAAAADPALAARHYARLRELGTGPDVAQRTLIEYLRAEQVLGRIRAEANVEVAASVLLGVCFQQAHTRHLLGLATVPFDAEHFAREFVGLLLTGLSPLLRPGTVSRIILPIRMPRRRSAVISQFPIRVVAVARNFVIVGPFRSTASTQAHSGRSDIGHHC